MERTQRIIDCLTALNDAMHENQCYACSHEFIEKVDEFGTDILADAIALLKEQPQIVLCKDCKHRPTKPDDYENGFDLEFPDGKCPCQCDDGWYSWYPPDDWFCANGETK